MKEFTLYIIGCTFSFFKTKEQILNTLNPLKVKTKFDIVFEVNEFEGTDQEHHSGSFREYISVNHNEKLKDVIKDYFNVHNQILKGEYFSVIEKDSDVVIMIEKDINLM